MPPRKKKQLTIWGGQAPEPEKYFGFCYLVTNLTSGRRYIGKKQYYVAKGKTKRRHTNIRSKQWKSQQWGESDWQYYTGSSRDLNGDITALGKDNFQFEIISQHITKAELYYAEVYLQVISDCLRKRLPDGEKMYYNKQIGAVKFIPPEYCEEADLIFRGGALSWLY